MSSLAELPDWSAFGEREAPLDTELLSPAAELAAVLQVYRADLATVRAEVQQARLAGAAALAQQAVFVVQLAVALESYQAALAEASLSKVHRHLRIVKDQMLDALRGAGLEIVPLVGRSFDEIADLVDVQGWRHRPEFTSEVVAEELEPLVKYRGEVVRLGRVVMGAPPEAAVAAEQLGEPDVDKDESAWLGTSAAEPSGSTSGEE